MKKILFDLLVTQPVAGSKFHGGGEYVKTIFKQLCEHSKEIEISVYYNFDVYMDNWVKNLIRDNGIEAINIRNHSELERSKIFDNIDIFFCGLLTPLDYFTPNPHITVIGIYHGIRSVELPIEKSSIACDFKTKDKIRDLIKLTFFKRYASKKKAEMAEKFKKCDILIGSSKQSIYSVKANFPGLFDEKLRLVYPPIKFTEQVADDKTVSKKYILIMGGNRWVKNTYRTILAVDELLSEKLLEGYSIKIVGGLSGYITKKIKNFDRYDIYGYVEASKLEELYAECDLFLYPSLNEGYGYPPLEAMRYGKTCIVSGVTSLPEIFGESVYYCNPYDIKEIETRILQAVDEKIPDQKIRERFERLTLMGKEEIAKLCEDIVSKY